MTRGAPALIGSLVVLCTAAAVLAQERHPLTGTWSGDWGPGAAKRTHVTMVMAWDGKAVAGTINPGADAIEVKAITLDVTSWTVRFEAEGKETSGHRSSPNVIGARGRKRFIAASDHSAASMLHQGQTCCSRQHAPRSRSTHAFELGTAGCPLQTESRSSVAAPELFREKRALTQLAFRRLLEWLDDGVESQGETYLEMRRRLVSYFDRRNRIDADELVDETFNRIAHTLGQGDIIATRPPARYCYVVARFVLLEGFRRDRKYVRVEGRRDVDVPRTTRITLVPVDDQQDVNEQRLDCLDRCLDGLRPEQRDLAIDYYRDVRRQRIERRRDLARRLGITTNALAIRACRIRDALMTCVEACRGK